MEKVVFFTMGPVFKTINSAPTSSALWFASMFFSNLNRRLCAQLYKAGYDIISPYYDNTDETNDGIGKYHDRIISVVEKSNDEISKELKGIIETVKKNSINDFPADFSNDKSAIDFFNNYLYVDYVILDNDDSVPNLIQKGTDILDVLELGHIPPKTNDNNLFNKLFYFSKDDKSKNTKIKQSNLFTNISKGFNQFLYENENKIRSIEEIANVENNGLKRNSYFSYVYADGDKISQLLKKINSFEELKKFTKACMNFNQAAGKLIYEFGGMTIYAGGDDLRFISPVISKNGKTVFELCQILNNLFIDIVDSQKVNNCISLSFGISIQYKKYPLYEVSSKMYSYLQLAKKYRKNIYFNLEKHSGQSFNGNILIDSNFDKTIEIIKYSNDTKMNIVKTLEMHETLFRIQIDNLKLKRYEKEQYCNIFKNLFDNSEQIYLSKYVENIANYIYEFIEGCSKEIDYAGEILNVLRLNKFLYEKEGE